MNEIFMHTFGAVTAIAAGIAMLTVFFMPTNRINRHLAPSGIIKLKGLLEEQVQVDLVLENGERIPAGRLVFQKADGIRVRVRPKTIKYIQETKPAE